MSNIKNESEINEKCKYCGAEDCGLIILPSGEQEWRCEDCHKEKSLEEGNH